jgi:DNA-binding HxlR family transcriptional regulator
LICEYKLPYIWYTFVTSYQKYTSILRYTAKLKAMEKHNVSECKKHLLPVRDALDMLGGKWKLPIIVALSFDNKHFREMIREIQGISPKMLSKELKDLETNQLVKRTVYDTSPVTVEYSLTPYGKSLQKLIGELRIWGAQHRKKMLTQK